MCDRAETTYTVNDGAIKPELPKSVRVHITPPLALNAALRLLCGFSLLYKWKCLFIKYC